MWRRMWVASRSLEQPPADNKQGNGDLTPTAARTESCQCLPTSKDEHGSRWLPEPPEENSAWPTPDFSIRDAGLLTYRPVS